MLLKLIKPACAEPAYEAAARIFSQMYEQITFDKITPVETDDGKSNIVIIGSDAVNDFLMNEIFDGSVKSPNIRYGTDDYCIYSYKKSDRSVLVLAGGRGRSTIYAVYDYFERFCNCHYFWDGDVIPHRSEIPLEDISITEQPRFDYRGLRYFAHRGLKRFQAEMWSFDDWKREIDWILKKRLNFFMLRIGMDDVWQRAFPDIVPYPKNFRNIEDEKGFNDRSDFWTLKYRGELRKQVMAYSRRMDLFTATDCGTMTHWYSRTPEEFLKDEKRKFLDQYDNNYVEFDTGKVLDFRLRENMDCYMKLTKIMSEEYDNNNYLFHTIGLGERKIYKDNQTNFTIKKLCYRRIMQNLRKEYPNSKLLVASWDFVGWWQPSEVRELINELDPERTIILDYTSDGSDSQQNFTNWGVVNKFPWIFGIFHAYESESELRGAYDIIGERLKIAADDVYCKGMIFWPELSHSDPIIIEYLSANAWAPLKHDVNEIVKKYCFNRYGAYSERMYDCWKNFLPFMKLTNWGSYSQIQSDNNTFKTDNFWFDHNDIWVKPIDYLRGHNTPPTEYVSNNIKSSQNMLKTLKTVIKTLAYIIRETTQIFILRDAVDIVRTICGRFLNYMLVSTVCYAETSDKIDLIEKYYIQLINLLADLLSFNNDFSLYHTLAELKKSAPVNPSFERTLKENIINGYCRQYCTELTDNIFIPEAKAVFAHKRACIQTSGKEADYTDLDKLSEEITEKFMKKPLSEMRHTALNKIDETMLAVSDTLEFVVSVL